MKIGSLVVEFLSDTSGYKKGAQEVNTSLDTTVAKTKDLSVSSKAASSDLLLLAGTATAAGYAIVRTGLAAGQTVQELNDLSYTTGIATQKIQQMQYAAMISGTDFSNVSNGINELSLSIADFGDESSGAHKAFSQLGVDPTGRSIDEVFEQTAKALVGVKDETQRNAIASELLGKNWKTLLPYIQTYIDKRDEISQAPVYSESEKKQLEESKVAWDKLINSVTIYSGKIISLSETMRTRANVFNPIAWLTGQNDYLSQKTGATGGADYGGKISSPAAAAIEDPLKGKTGEQADIFILENVTIPKLQKKFDDLRTSGTASYEEITLASHDLIEAKEQLIELTTKESEADRERNDALIESYRNRERAIERVNDAQKNIDELREDAISDLQDAGTDVGAARRIIKNLQKSERHATSDLVEAQGEVSQYTSTFNQIAGGADPSTVKGTSQYEEEQAKSLGASGGITITGPIYLNGDKSFENYLSSARASAGIRNRL